MYAIGDIHGRLDLTLELLRAIEADDKSRSPTETRLILLGDLIDRGPASAELVTMFATTPSRWPTTVLRGNHEEMLNAVLAGNDEALRAWLSHGGRAALDSWGIDPAIADLHRQHDLIAALQTAIPLVQRRWLATLPTSLRVGDYFFTHAGVHPGVALHRQRDDDLLWIRGEFLSSNADHGAVVVHGHTVEEDGPHLLHNRIGLDTGAYRTGRLSAVGLEGTERWTMST